MVTKTLLPSSLHREIDLWRRYFYERRQVTPIEASAQFDTAAQLLWRDVKSSLESPGTKRSAKEAMLFHSAQPVHYVRTYRIEPWQWFRTPFHCLKLKVRLMLLRTSLTDPSEQDRLVFEADQALTVIEFAGKPLGPRQRWKARSVAIEKRLSAKLHRKTFSSLAVTVQDGKVVPRNIPRALFLSTHMLRFAFTSIACLLTTIATANTLVRGCLTCAELGSIYIASLAGWFAYMSHIFGPEWKSSEKLAKALLPD